MGMDEHSIWLSRWLKYHKGQVLFEWKTPKAIAHASPEYDVEGFIPLRFYMIVMNGE